MVECGLDHIIMVQEKRGDWWHVAFRYARALLRVMSVWLYCVLTACCLHSEEAAPFQIQTCATVPQQALAYLSKVTSEPPKSLEKKKQRKKVDCHLSPGGLTIRKLADSAGISGRIRNSLTDSSIKGLHVSSTINRAPPHVPISQHPFIPYEVDFSEDAADLETKR